MLLKSSILPIHHFRVKTYDSLLPRWTLLLSLCPCHPQQTSFVSCLLQIPLLQWDALLLDLRVLGLDTTRICHPDSWFFAQGHLPEGYKAGHGTITHVHRLKYTVFLTQLPQNTIFDTAAHIEIVCHMSISCSSTLISFGTDTLQLHMCLMDSI